MNKKTLYVSRIKALANGKDNVTQKENSNRFSLQENTEHFCIVVVPFKADGTPDDERLAEIQALKGKEVIAIERAITTADGTIANQWYLLTEEAVDTYASREAKRDVNAMIEAKKELQAATLKVSLTEALKKAGAGALVA